jgi:elongator complex protein 3
MLSERYGDKHGEKQIQHQGIGKKLVNKAIDIAKQNGYNKISVISGEGVKEYYFKLGFQDTSHFMIKTF